MTGRKSKHRSRSKKIDVTLSKLEGAELIKQLADSLSVPLDRAYFFRHVLIQDAAQSTLLKFEHKRLHGFVALALEKVNADRLDDYAPALARHFAEAEDDAKTLEYAQRAGEQAMRMYATPEAIAAFTLALRAAGQVNAPLQTWQHLYTELGRAYELSSRHETALAIYDEMEQTGKARGEPRLELAARLARLPIYATPTPMYDPPLAETLADEALALARQLGDREAEATALWLRMLIKIRSWRPEQGIQDGETGLALAQALGLREREAYILHDLGSSYYGIGEYRRGREIALQARQIWQELDNKPMLADNLSAAANGLVFAGDLDEVLALAHEAFQITQSIGNTWGQSYSLMSVGMVHEEQGDCGQALAAMQDCIRYGKQAGFIVPQTQTRAALARLYYRLGAAAEGEREAMLALDEQTSHSNAMHPIATTLRIRIYILTGKWAEAAAALSQAKERISQLQVFRGAMSLLIDAADVDIGMGRGEYARVVPLLDSMVQEMRALGVRLFLPEALFNQSVALRALGKPDEAYAVLVDADARARELGSRRMGWQILAALSEIEHARGDDTAATAHHAEAQSILEYIIARIPQEFRAGFLNLPQVHAIYPPVT